MRAALAAHDDVLHKAIEAHGGWLFKHTGDGVCAAFVSPTGAVDAAVAAQRELELPVRMGIATGEAELRGADYFGAVLNRAARLMAAGHGGQILLAESTAGLLSGVDLIDLGPRRLRDLPTPVGVFERQDCRRSFRRCGRWMRVRGTCGLRFAAMISVGSACTSARASARWQGRTMCSCRARCATS
jgi:class 3 adenylate cyclase